MHCLVIRRVLAVAFSGTLLSLATGAESQSCRLAGLEDFGLIAIDQQTGASEAVRSVSPSEMTWSAALQRLINFDLTPHHAHAAPMPSADAAARATSQPPATGQPANAAAAAPALPPCGPQASSAPEDGSTCQLAKVAASSNRSRVQMASAQAGIAEGAASGSIKVLCSPDWPSSISLAHEHLGVDAAQQDACRVAQTVGSARSVVDAPAGSPMATSDCTLAPPADPRLPPAAAKTASPEAMVVTVTF